MPELFFRPKGGYVLRASLEEMHEATRLWLSEIAFWMDELHFLQHLADRYFLEIIKLESNEEATKMFRSLSKWKEQDLPELRAGIQKHETHLAAILENPFEPDETSYRDEHDLLDNKVALFMKNFKALKNELFRVTEKIKEKQ